MELYDLCPYVRFAGIIPCVLDGVKIRRAYDARLFYVLEGNAALTTATAVYPLFPGASVYIPTAFPYTVDGSLKAVSLNFDLTVNAYGSEARCPDSVTEFDADAVFDTTAPPEALSKILYAPCVPELNEAFTETVLKKSVGNDAAEAEISGLVKTILAVLLQKQAQPANYDGTADRVLLFMKQHYDRELTGEMLAKEFGYHPFYLNKLFKNRTGLTVHQALQRERVTVAKQLLIRTDLPVEEIAASVGFKERVSFYYAFKKATGASPDLWRRQNR